MILNPTTGGVDETTGAILTNGLLLTGNGTFDLNNSNNAVGTIAANINGSLSYTDANTLTIGTVGGVNGVTDTAATGVVSLTSNGSILDPTAASITANTINLTAADNIGSGTGDVSTNPVVTDSPFLNVIATSGNVYLDSTGVEINLNAPLGSATLLTNDVILDTITTLNDFTLEAASGNITLNGTTQSTAGAVDLLADNGSINANPGSIVIANADSFSLLLMVLLGWRMVR